MIYKYLMLIIIIVNYSGIAQGKVIKTVTVKYVMNETSTIVENDISNSTSTQVPPQPDNLIDSLPKWFWIVLGITSGLILCCLCCCPETLRAILCCPLCCALNVILFPVRCCLNCLGFEVAGPRANSHAASFQSRYYGGHTPSGSLFSTLQSYSMRRNNDYL